MHKTETKMQASEPASGMNPAQEVKSAMAGFLNDFNLSVISIPWFKFIPCNFITIFVNLLVILVETPSKKRFAHPLLIY